MAQAVTRGDFLHGGFEQSGLVSGGDGLIHGDGGLVNARPRFRVQTFHRAMERGQLIHHWQDQPGVDSGLHFIMRRLPESGEI